MLFWKPWLDTVNFGFEVQSVMALRLLKMAAGGAESSAAPTRMVTEPTVMPEPTVMVPEKVMAVADAQVADAQVADTVVRAQGKSIKTVTKRAKAPIKRRVQGNPRLKGSET
jgi:hypothetical protein